MDPRATARIATRHSRTESELITMDWNRDNGPLDPRHVFLHASDVLRRYGWGKTKGYQNLKDRDLVPPPVMTRPDRWRLDQLLAWEERRMAMAEATLRTLLDPNREEVRVADLLPQPKRRRRSA